MVPYVLIGITLVHLANTLTAANRGAMMELKRRESMMGCPPATKKPAEIIHAGSGGIEDLLFKRKVSLFPVAPNARNP